MCIEPPGLLRLAAFRSASEARLRQTLDPEAMDGEERARFGFGRNATIQRLADRSDEQHVESGAAEHDARRVADRELDRAIEGAVGGEAAQASVQHLCRPEITLGIDGRAIGPGAVRRRIDQHALVAQRAARRVVVIGEDAAAPGIGEIEGTAVRTEARAVREDHLALQHLDREVGIEAIERAQGIAHLACHGAGKKAPLAIDLAVIETRARIARFTAGNRRGTLGGEVEEMKTALERHHGAALGAKRQRADHPRHHPFAHVAAVGRGAMDDAAHRIDPVERLFPNIPERPFAEPVLDGADAANLDPRFSWGAQRLPVGSLLKGSSLSTRISAGSPSTRSAMMLRRISSLPPAMRRPGEKSSACWKSALAGIACSSVMIPAMPIKSMPKLATSCIFVALTSLPIDASGPGVSPRDSRVIVRKRVYLSPCVLTYHSASFSRTA